MVRDKQTGAKMLREAIQECSLTVKELAERLGISDSLLRKYRNGTRPIPPGFLYELAGILAKQQATLAKWTQKLSKS